MSLADFRFATAGGLEFGMGTDIHVAKFDDGGKPEVRSQDSDLAGGDGRVFGRDLLSGRTLTWQLTIVDRADPWGTYERLAGEWSGDSVRFTPGAVSYITWKRPGRDAARVYGRLRNIAATWDTVGVGVVPVVATFAAVDHLWYSDELHSLTLAPGSTQHGGVVIPAVVPWLLEGTVERPGAGVNSGTVATWPVVTVVGPVTDGRVEVPGRWGVQLDVPAGDSVTLDTRPWRRSVTYSDGSNAGDALTRRVPPLSTLGLPPGSFTVNFGGAATTSRTSCRFEWRDARRSP